MANEKFETGKTASENAEYQRAADAFLEAANLFNGVKENEENYAACLGNSANALKNLGLYAKAQNLMEKAVLMLEKFSGSKSSNYATGLNNLAEIYREQGNKDNAKLLKAKHLHEQALNIRRNISGFKNPDVASSLNNLALIYAEQRNYRKAKSLHKRALAIRRKTLLCDDPDLASSLNNLATLYAIEGDTETATKLLENANEILGKSLLHINHPYIDGNLDNLAQVIIQTNLSDNSFTSIAQLHERLFQFLVDVTPIENKSKITFKQIFTLRTSKNDEQGRLSKGYWFSGDDESLYFSCWKGIDTTVQMPTIAIVIDTEQKLSIHLNGKDSPRKAEFLADIASLLGGFAQVPDKNGKLEAQWKKTYSQTWEQALEEFLSTDKPQIDEYLAFKGNEIDDFTQISEKEFAQSLKFTLFLREKLKSSVEQELSEVGKPLKLQFLQLENIGHFKEVGFDLSKQVTILIGENGSGKSTVLKAIALGLSNVAQTMDTALVQDYLRIIKTDADKEHNSLKKQYCPTGEIRLGFQLNKLQTQTLEFKTTDLGGVEINPFIENNDDWLLVSQNRFIDLILGFPQGKKRPQKSLAKIEAPNLNDVLALIEERDTPEWKLDIKKWIYHLHAQRDENPQNLEKINTVFELFSKIIEDEDNEAFIRLKDVVYNQETREEDVIICTPDMPEGISLDLISQGYNNIFVWIGRLIMRLYDALKVHQQEHHAVSKDNKFLKNPNTRGKRYEANSIYEIHGIVLIDEIDTYLHPKWQRNILQVLAETFPCLQFVVTSHSSMVLGYLKQWKNASVFKVKADEIIPIHHFYGRNEIDLFWELHGIEARPKEIQEKISDLYAAFDANELTQSKVLLTELREILGENDPIIVELATAIELMEELS
ncbi:MAG: tetratricopeptide repeat protein [Thiotrichaceae bacterium]|nr:tetratricopeptide repeat protein [Thiotrichaceae bacterium]